MEYPAAVGTDPVCRGAAPEKGIISIFPDVIFVIFVARSTRVVPGTGGEDIIEWLYSALREDGDGDVCCFEGGGGHEEAGGEAEVWLVTDVCCGGVVVDVEG